MVSTVFKGISIITLLLLFGYAVIYLTFRQSYLTQVNCNGEKIIIDRDQYGIATLHVNSIESYLYGLGTIEAEDRLFQMSLRAYSAQGRLSQFLGQSTLQFDRFMREVNIKKWAEARSKRLKAENISEYRRLEFMTNGINDRVASFQLLPLEFYLTGMQWQNFTVSHIFYLFGQFEWSISKNLVDQYTRSFLLNNYTQQEIEWILPNKKQTWAFKSIPIVSDQEIPQRLRTQNMKKLNEKTPFEPVPAKRLKQIDSVQYGNIGDATNCWAVKGQYTESGYPILSNDPHLESVVPSQWYPFKVNLTLNGYNHYIAGGSNPGSPHAYGKSNYYAVGFSVLPGDSQDLYKQTIDDGKYLIDGEWKDLLRRTQIIYIKKGSQLIKEQYQVLQTHRGPIINYIFSPLGSYNIENDNISLAWTGFHDQYQSYINTTYSFLSKDLQEITHVLKAHTSHLMSINIMIVTKDNHIIMQQGGIHPLRRNYDSGNYIKNGQTSEHDWIGIIPAQDRIRIIDPPKGYFIHANNRLSDSQYYGGYFDSTIFTPRADRLNEIIKQQIKSGRKINSQFMKKVLMDTVDVYCRQILPQITSVIEESKQYLGSFDCDFKAESTIATIYEVFMYKLHLKMRPFIPQKMGLASFQQMKQGLYNYIHFAYRGDIQKQQKMRQAWNQAFEFCQNFFKSKDNSQWIWSTLHTDVTSHMPFKNHPLLSKIYNLQFPGSGNGQTLNVAKMNSLQFGDFSTTHRANTRVIYNMDSKSSSWYIIDTGVSQNIFSKHYYDMWSLFKQGLLIQIKSPSAIIDQEQL